MKSKRKVIRRKKLKSLRSNNGRNPNKKMRDVMRAGGGSVV